MKHTTHLAALVAALLLLCALFPAALGEAAGGDDKDGLLSYLADNQYIGRWAGYAIDNGGVLETRINGFYVSKYYAITIFPDGTLMFENFSNPFACELQKTDSGFRFYTQGQPNEIVMEGRRMTFKGPQYDVYLDQCEDPVGIWKAVSYESEGSTFPADKLFTDGCTLTLDEYGNGAANIHGIRTIELYMSFQDGEFFGGDAFSDPQFDVQKDIFKLTYGQNAVVTFQRCMTEDGDLPVMAVPSYYKSQPEGGDTQVLQTNLFSVAFPKEGWENDMDRLYDSLREGRVQFRFTDEDKHLYASFSIEVYSDEALAYRNGIRWLSEIADKTTLAQTQISGVNFSYIEYEDGGTYHQEYVGRVPQANMNLYITISESTAGLVDYQPILDSISFTLPTISPQKAEPPLPEDSASYVPRPGKAYIGDREITAAWLPMDTPFLVSGSYISWIELQGDTLALHGDTLYILTGRRLYALQNKDGRLFRRPVFPEGVLKLDDEYSYLSMTGNGTLYVTNGAYRNFSVRDGAVTPINESIGSLAMHPDGEWGISFCDDRNTNVIHITQSGITAQTWALHDLRDPKIRTGRYARIHFLSVFEDRVYVAGDDATRDNLRVVSAYDFDGSELFVLGSENWSDPEALSFATDIAQTKDSVVILDGGTTLKVLSLSGELIGTIDCNQLLGTKDAEILSITPAEDGLYLSAAKTREDRSCTELLIFHITGL